MGVGQEMEPWVSRGSLRQEVGPRLGLRGSWGSAPAQLLSRVEVSQLVEFAAQEMALEPSGPARGTGWNQGAFYRSGEVRRSIPEAGVGVPYPGRTTPCGGYGVPGYWSPRRPHPSPGFPH